MHSSHLAQYYYFVYPLENSGKIKTPELACAMLSLVFSVFSDQLNVFGNISKLLSWIMISTFNSDFGLGKISDIQPKITQKINIAEKSPAANIMTCDDGLTFIFCPKVVSYDLLEIKPFNNRLTWICLHIFISESKLLSELALLEQWVIGQLKL